MKKNLAYGLLVLLTLLSCTREPAPYAEVGGNTVDIQISTAGLRDTKAVTPGDGQGGDGGGFPEYYMSFEAPSAGTLTVTVTGSSGSELGVLMDGAVIPSQSSDYASQHDLVFTGLNEGTVLIYPIGGNLKFYKIQFDYLGDDPSTPAVIETDHALSLIWDFSDAAFQALLATANLLDPYTVNTARSWTVTLDGLTIWSQGNSTWNSTGYFEWGGYYTNPDLVILIADATDIVKVYPTSGTLKQKTLTEAVVTFSGVSGGDYTVYAFGNTEGLWDLDGQGSGQTAKQYLLSLTTTSQLENLQFAAKTNYMQYYSVLSDLDNDVAGPGKIDPTHPWDDGMELSKYGLPVSAKASLHVSGGGNGETYLELLRCVAKVTAIIINNTGEAMTLYDYKHVVKKINHTTGWVIPHGEAEYIGDVGHLAAYPNKKYNMAIPIPITQKGSQAYDWFVFPSEGPYTIDIAFTLFKGTAKEHTYTYTDLPVTNWKGENIMELGRNQHLTVTTRISKGLTVSFNFRVEPWEENTATVEFD